MSSIIFLVGFDLQPTPCTPHLTPTFPEDYSGVIQRKSSRNNLVAAFRRMKFKQNTTQFLTSAFLAITLHSSADELRLGIDSDPPLREGAHAGYAPIVEKVAPAVVSIASTQNVAVPKIANRRFFDPFTGRLFQRRQMLPGREIIPQPKGTGSGVILTKDGYVVTNHHVIREADDIKVAVGNDGDLYDAKIIGFDEATDLAVLKIDGTDFPTVRIGSTKNLKAGDFALAIGSPFNLSNTVTHGIISALGRTDLGITGEAGYEDFIQTDASINPGNSGGALVDNKGRMIGINTAIFSRSGGNLGIGFAIPSDLVVNITEQIINYGEVRRGYLGVHLGDLTPDLAQALGVDEDGAVIHDVMPDSPAEKAGLQDGDVVTHLNDRPVDGAARLRLLVGTARPGTEALFKIIREGKELEIKCQIGSQDRRISSRSGRPTQTTNGTLPGELVPGLQVADVTDEDRSRLALPEGTTGVIIESVAPDSPASRAKLSPGEMITGINRTPVTGVEDAFEVAENALGEKQGKLLLLRIIGENGSRYVAVKTS